MIKDLTAAVLNRKTDARTFCCLIIQRMHEKSIRNAWLDGKYQLGEAAGDQHADE